MERKKVRSYVLRAGRMSEGQKRAKYQLADQYLIPFDPSNKLAFKEIFSNDNKTYLEIGFGMGDATVEIAGEHLNRNFIGIEVHPPGIGRILNLIEDGSLRNLKIIEHDAVEVATHMLDEKSLDGIHIFFPDPWPKKKHHKRRLINTEFLRLIAPKLIDGGYLHISTDWEPYAEHILSTLEQNSQFNNTTDDYSERPDYRPITKFERRGLKLGHQVWDITFNKI